MEETRMQKLKMWAKNHKDELAVAGVIALYGSLALVAVKLYNSEIKEYNEAVNEQIRQSEEAQKRFREQINQHGALLIVADNGDSTIVPSNWVHKVNS